MAGYTRNDTAGNIADGNVISAAPLDGEFDAIQDAFALSTGHTHDGSTTGDGGPVSKLGPSQQLEQTTTALTPDANNSIDLGTSSAEFKDLYLDGIAYIDRLTVAASDGSADGVGSHLQPMTDASFDLGSTTYLWNNAYLVNLNVRKNDAPVITLTNTSTDMLTADSVGSIVFETLDTQQSGVDVAKIEAIVVDSLDDSGGDDVKLVFQTGNAEALTTALTLQDDDVVAPDDVFLRSDAAVLSFGADDDVSLTHVADTGLLLNGSREIQFRDSGLTIGSTADGQLDIDADTKLEIVAPTVEITGAVDIDNINIDGNAITSTNTNGDITITPDGDGKIVLDGLNFPIADGTENQFLQTDGSGQLGFADVITDVVGDTTPQLGGMLDVNGNAIGDGTLELIKFSETASAVNEITITNAATGGHPLIQASGDDTDINLQLDGKGSGVVEVVDDLTIGGNLTVNGTTTTISTTNTVVSDTLIELGNGTTGSPVNDSGLVIERGDSDNAFIGFDESADKFTMGTGTFTGASTGDLTITAGTLVADLEGDVTGDVTAEKVIASNTNASDTGTDVAIQIGASTDWTVLVTSSDELVFRHNGVAKMLLTTTGHLKVIDDITAFADLSSYDGA
jgi:hypothetical protein